MSRLVVFFLGWLGLASAAVAFTLSPRVVGGGPVPDMSDFSYQVAIYIHNEISGEDSFCGGVLIADEWVLSAAHCFADLSRAEKNIWVYAGSTTRKQSYQESELVGVADVIIHPLYDNSTPPAYDYDIAAFRLDRPWSELASCSDTTCAAIPYTPASSSEKLGTSVTVSGWGSTDGENDSKSMAEKLEFADLELTACLESSWTGKDISDRMICASDPPYYTADACFGDSGGPLVSADKNLLLGLVSAGPDGCADKQFPGIYTRVSSFRRWIDAVQTDEYSSWDFTHPATRGKGSGGLLIGSLGSVTGYALLVLLAVLAVGARMGVFRNKSGCDL